MTSSTHLKTSNLAGIIYMMIAIFMLSSMDAVAKWLVEAEYSVFQILFVRGCINITILLAAMPFVGGSKLLRTSRPWAHVFRGIFGFAAPTLFFTALYSMPIAEATVVFFISPFVMTALSIPIFGEKVGIHRWGAILLGFGGVLYVAQPSSDVFNPAVLIVIGAALSYSLVMLASRWLGKTDSTFTIVFYVTVGAVLLSALFIPFYWKELSLEGFAVIGLMAVLSLAGHICIVKAFTIGEVGVITPFEYTGLVWAVLLGLFFFQEIPSFNVWIGMSMIGASGLYLVYRENKKRPGHL